jgi:hypothetical protein
MGEGNLEDRGRLMVRTIVGFAVVVLLTLGGASPATAHHSGEPGLVLRVHSNCRIIGIDQNEITFYAHVKASETRTDVGLIWVDWKVYHRSEVTGDAWARVYPGIGEFRSTIDGELVVFRYNTTDFDQPTDEGWRLDAKVMFMDPDGVETIVFHRYRGLARSQRERPRHGAVCHDTSTD